jgi:hypothetical protein
MQAVGVRGDLRTKGPEIRALRLGGTNQLPKIRTNQVDDRNDNDVAQRQSRVSPPR